MVFKLERSEFGARSMQMPRVTEDGAGVGHVLCMPDAPPGAPSPVKLRQTYPRDAFR